MITLFLIVSRHWRQLTEIRWN